MIDRSHTHTHTHPHTHMQTCITFARRGKMRTLKGVAVVCLFVFETQSYYVAQSSLKLTILLPHLPSVGNIVMHLHSQLAMRNLTKQHCFSGHKQ
jgi:hypothetical protein